MTMKEELVQTDVPGLFKEISSGGLINKNNDALAQYKKQKQKDRKIQELEKRIEMIEFRLNQMDK